MLGTAVCLCDVIEMRLILVLFCVRADRETMMARAGGGPGTGQQFDDGQAGLVYNEGR
jgi:hypothetical protein